MPAQQHTKPETLIRLPEVMRRTGRGRTAIYTDMAAGKFPPSVSIGPRAVAWPESAIDEWIAERVTQAAGNAA